MMISIYYFFNDTASTEIYTLSLTTLFRSGPQLEHRERSAVPSFAHAAEEGRPRAAALEKDHRSPGADRKSTRLNSSHPSISYAVFCLKKKKQYTNIASQLTALGIVATLTT